MWKIGIWRYMLTLICNNTNNLSLFGLFWNKNCFENSWLFMTSSSTKFCQIKVRKGCQNLKFSHFVLQFCKFLKSYCCFSSPGKNDDNFCNTTCNHTDHKNHHFQSISYFKFKYENIKIYILSNNSIHFPSSANRQR